jgi:hypothetical protein
VFTTGSWKELTVHAYAISALCDLGFSFSTFGGVGYDFTGLFGRVTGVFARIPIKRAHRRHMESFKRFAESRL